MVSRHYDLLKCDDLVGTNKILFLPKIYFKSTVTKLGDTINMGDYANQAQESSSITTDRIQQLDERISYTNDQLLKLKKLRQIISAKKLTAADLDLITQLAY